MTRYIAILALALTAGLSSGNASAQQANAVPLLALSMQSASDGLAVMDLWFALVDSGYTEDEAFEMIEMMMDEDGWLVGGGYKLQGWVYDEPKNEMYWVD